MRLLVDLKQQVLQNNNLLKALLNKTRPAEVDEEEEETEMFGELPLRDLESLNEFNKRLSSSRAIRKKLVSFLKMYFYPTEVIILNFIFIKKTFQNP